MAKDRCEEDGSLQPGSNSFAAVVSRSSDKSERSHATAEHENPCNLIIVVPPVSTRPQDEDLTISIRRCDGGSIKIILGPRIAVNEHSSLRREWVTVVDSRLPAELMGCIGITSSYRHSSDHESDGFFFQTKYSLRAREPLTAFEVKFLTFDVWGEHQKTLVAADVRDLAAGQIFEFKGQWSLFSENEASEFLASIAFISKIRTADGRILNADIRPVMEEAHRFASRLDESDFEPTKTPA